MNIWEIATNYYQYFLRGTRTTILISLLTVFCGSILGCLIALMRLSKAKALQKFASTYITVIRGTPMLVQLYIVYYQLDFISYPTGTLFGVDLERALPCIIALSINSSAYVAEIIRAGIQAVDKGQMEGARSCGMTNAQAMRCVVMPQAVKNILPAIGNEFVTMVKETSIPRTSSTRRWTARTPSSALTLLSRSTSPMTSASNSRSSTCRSTTCASTSPRVILTLSSPVWPRPRSA